tara:strand:+ start:1462 stop:1797 length:336 start_codon:yes stop_codon:yes gene_type:complete
MAATANLVIEQGTSFSSGITVKDLNGKPFDLSGYTGTSNMAKGYASTHSRQALTVGFNSDRTDGVINLSLTATETAALDAPARYVYDCDITASNGTVTRVIQGLITVKPNV